jgi:uncharacterized protein YcfL
MKRTLLTLATLILAMTALPACDTVNTYSSESQNITDAGLNNDAKVTNIRKSLVSGNLLHVQADITNTQDDDADINYKFEWYDAQGSKLDSPFDSFQRISIAPRETLTVSATATSPKATDFRLKLIEGQ